MTASSLRDRPVLVAPDSFKGTLSAVEVAEALARGIEGAGRPADRCPIADGGEGTAAVLLEALGGELGGATATDPLGREIEARFVLLGDGRAVVEVAAASGLGLVDEAERDAEAASSRGTGELMLAAAESGAREVLVAAGGSATTDGGAGALAVLEGWSLPVTILCDVRTPFERAAATFAPQKGADPDAVRRLTRRLAGQAKALPRDPTGEPMTGAAGGLSGGLWAAVGAKLVPGAAFVLDTVGFDARMKASRAVVTGEGRLDLQSLEGKAVGEVATRARQNGVPCHAVVGHNDLDLFDQRILDLETVDEAGTLQALTEAGRRLASAV